MDENTINTPTDGAGGEEQPSILKQITGALVGGTIALVAYYAYDFSAPMVTAWLIAPNYEAELGHNTIADIDTDETDARRIQAQARRIAANTRTVPEYTQYTPPVVSSSAASVSSSSSSAVSSEVSSEEQDSIWEQAWKDNEQPAEPNYLAQVDTMQESMPMYEEPEMPSEPVQGANGEQVPVLPDSGFGIWAVVMTAGAAVGSQYKRLRA